MDPTLPIFAKDLSACAMISEAVAYDRDPDAARTLLAALGQWQGRHASLGVVGMCYLGPVSRIEALLRRACGETDAAIACFERAYEEAMKMGAAPTAARIDVEAAEVLLDSSRSLHTGSLESASAHGETLARARERLARGRHAAQAMGLQRLLRRIDALTETFAHEASPNDLRQAVAHAMETSTGQGRAPSIADRTATPTMRLERADDGAWNVTYAGRTHTVKDSRGMQWLHRLVQRAGEPMHVLDLTSEGDAGAQDVADRGDAGDLLDARAIAAYRERALEIQRELHRAEAWNDTARVDRLRAELDALADQLAAGTSLGGRPRRAAGATERARVNAQRRLKDAIERLGTCDAELERFLAWAVRTGTYCVYRGAPGSD